MSEKEVREVFERYIEALNAHEFDRMTEFIHDELTENGRPVTRDDVIAELKGHGDAVPDFTWRVRDVAIDGDRVAARLFNKGTPRRSGSASLRPAKRSSTPSTPSTRCAKDASTK